jgi:hypothetical protein
MHEPRSGARAKLYLAVHKSSVSVCLPFPVFITTATGHGFILLEASMEVSNLSFLHHPRRRRA